jgi:hypothetical protein
MLSETMKGEIARLCDEASIAETCIALKRRRVEIIDLRIKTLSAFPVIEPVNGVRGVPTRVTRAVAEQSLRSGTHRLVTP